VYNCQLREKAVEEPKEAKDEATSFSAAPAVRWFHPTRQRRFHVQSRWLSPLLLESFGREAPTFLGMWKPNSTVFRVRFTVASSKLGLEMNGEELGDAPDTKQSV